MKELAEQVGELLGSRGLTVISGGYEGAMGAVSRGAARTGGHVVGITTSIFSDREANAHLDEVHVEPDYTFSKSLLPEGNPIRKEYETADFGRRATEAIERPELCGDERFASSWARSDHSRELVEELERSFRGRSLEAWSQKLDAAGLIWAPVRTVDEVIHDPQARALGYFYEEEIQKLVG